MKLSMSLIARYLRKYEPECHILEDTQSIRGIRFFSDHLPSFSLDYVYLGTSRDYFQDPRYEDSLLLSNGQNQMICQVADYEQLLNDVLASFEFYNQLEQDLIMAGGRHSSIASMMTLAECVTEDPVVVFDIEGKLVTAANFSAIKDQEFLQTLLEENILGTNILGRVFADRDGKISHDLTDEPQHLHSPGKDELGAIAMYISYEGERVGFLLMFPSSEFEAGIGMTLMPYFAAAFGQAEEFSSSISTHQGTQSIFLRLLQGEQLTSQVLDKFYHRLDFHSDAVILLLRTLAIQNHTFCVMLMNDLRQWENQCVLCEYQKDVVMFTQVSSLNHMIPTLKKELIRRNIAAGVSMPIQSTDQIRTAYEQAVFAVGSSTEPGVRYCRDLALSYLLRSLQEKEMALKLLHPAIHQLEAYDKENRTELKDTLICFVKNHCRQKETSEELHVHLNTLKYRIHRIEEICTIDYHDTEEIFYLELSMRLLSGKTKQDLHSDTN